MIWLAFLALGAIWLVVYRLLQVPDDRFLRPLRDGDQYCQRMTYAFGAKLTPPNDPPEAHLDSPLGRAMSALMKGGLDYATYKSALDDLIAGTLVLTKRWQTRTVALKHIHVFGVCAPLIPAIGGITNALWPQFVCSLAVSVAALVIYLRREPLQRDIECLLVGAPESLRHFQHLRGGQMARIALVPQQRSGAFEQDARYN